MFYTITIHILPDDGQASSETCKNLIFFENIIVREMKIVCNFWSKLWEVYDRRLERRGLEWGWEIGVL